MLRFIYAIIEDNLQQLSPLTAIYPAAYLHAFMPSADLFQLQLCR